MQSTLNLEKRDLIEINGGCSFAFDIGRLIRLSIRNGHSGSNYVNVAWDLAEWHLQCD